MFAANLIEINMNKLFIALASLFLTTLGGVAQSIDAEKSVVNFSIDNMKWKTVEGSFKGMSGKINFDASQPQKSSMSVCIKASTVFTDNEKRDEHLRTEDFFDVKKYPTICFEDESMVKTESGYLVKGKLTMKNVTKQVEIPFSYANGEFSGKLMIKRLDFNVGEDTGTFMVGDEVQLEIICKTKTGI